MANRTSHPQRADHPPRLSPETQASPDRHGKELQTNDQCRQNLLVHHPDGPESRLRCHQTTDDEGPCPDLKIPTSDGIQASTKVLGGLVVQMTSSVVAVGQAQVTMVVDHRLLLRTQTPLQCQI